MMVQGKEKMKNGWYNERDEQNISECLRIIRSCYAPCDNADYEINYDENTGLRKKESTPMANI